MGKAPKDIIRIMAAECDVPGLLATVDALQSRLAATEGLLREARLHISGHLVMPTKEQVDEFCARIDAHLAPPPAAQAPQNMAQAAIDAYEARIKALERERDEALASRSRAEDIIIAERKSASAERDRIRGECRSASMRAEAAEAEVARLRAAPTLTAEDRAWMDARQECDYLWSPEHNIGVTAKDAIAARARRKGGGA